MNYLYYIGWALAIIFLIFGVYYFITSLSSNKTPFKFLNNIIKGKNIEISALLLTVSFLIFYTIDTNELKKINLEIKENSIKQNIEEKRPVVIPTGYSRNLDLSIGNFSNSTAINIKPKIDILKENGGFVRLECSFLGLAPLGNLNFSVTLGKGCNGALITNNYEDIGKFFRLCIDYTDIDGYKYYTLSDAGSGKFTNLKIGKGSCKEDGYK